MVAVITADLIDSSNYSEALTNGVISAIKQEFKNFKKQFEADFKIYRGDSLQGILEHPQHALLAALILKSAVLKQSAGEKTRADLKISIGIGEIDFKAKNLEESNGPAFHFSGRALDAMKTENTKIAITTADENLNSEFEASLALLDEITTRWSIASAEVVYYLLYHKKEVEIAQELGISQSAVNQRKKAAGWEAVSKLLKRYESLISKRYSE